MIKNFEARYQSILEPKTKDLDGTSSHHKEDTTSRQKNNYHLDKKRSNQLLNGIKVILFVTGLSLINPIQANAEEEMVVQEFVLEEQTKETQGMPKTISVISFLILSIGVVEVFIDIKKFSKEANYTNPVFPGELSGQSSNDTPQKVLKYLKLANELEDKYGRL